MEGEHFDFSRGFGIFDMAAGLLPFQMILALILISQKAGKPNPSRPHRSECVSH
jgi:hypothetical protein